MHTCFRTILRAQTRADHDRVDHLFTTLDIGTLRGFRAFATVHLSCFEVMRAHTPAHRAGGRMLGQMTAALRADLAVIDADEATMPQPLARPLDSLAVDYLVAGSRLGSRVLFKRWARSANPQVQSANHYFGLPTQGDFWKTTCDALAALPGDSVRAAAITRDTKILFGLFTTAAHNMTASEDLTQ